MSINPPRLSNLWYTRMNNAYVPKLEGSNLSALTSRYKLFDDNVSELSPMLAYAVKCGWMKQEQVIEAISEPDMLLQISLVSKLVAEQFWIPFTTTVSTMMDAHKSTIRALIADSLKHDPETQSTLLANYDSILNNREQMMTFSMSLPKEDAGFGDDGNNIFASRITFSEAYLTEFNMNKFAFDNRLQNTFYKLIQTVMAHQFECSTIDINSGYNNWLTEELFCENDIELIGEYITQKQGEYELEQLYIDLNMNDEMISTIEDYGVECAYDYWCMSQLEDSITEISKTPTADVQKSLATLATVHPLLLPVQALFDYFEKNINSRAFPFDVGSDVDVSEQLIYSFCQPAEESCIQDASERFYNGNEFASLNLRLSDDNALDFFENFSISTCMISLLLAVIELRD